MTNNEIIEFCLKEINSLRGCWDAASMRKAVMAHNVMEEVKRRMAE